MQECRNSIGRIYLRKNALAEQNIGKWDYMEKAKNKNTGFPFMLRDGRTKAPITANVLLCKKAWAQMRIEIRNKNIAENNKINDKIKFSEILEYVKKYKPYEQGWIKRVKIMPNLEHDLANEGRSAADFKLYALLRDEKIIRYEVQPPKETAGKYEDMLREIIYG